MTADYFMEAIVETVAKPAAQHATGGWLPKSPIEEEIEHADWLKKLTESDRKHVERVAREAVDHALFSLFGVLDTVHFIEAVGPKTHFEIFAIKEGERVKMYPAGGHDLHDLYNWYSRDRYRQGAK